VKLCFVELLIHYHTPWGRLEAGSDERMVVEPVSWVYKLPKMVESKKPLR
jgi:hypothetical protein